MFVIHIDNAKLTLLEQQPFAVYIVFKTCVFCRSDVIRFNVRENTNLKRNACRPVQHQSLRRYFHHNTVASCFYHPVKIRLHGVGLRGRIGRRDMLLSDDRLDRSDQSDFVSRTFQDGSDHIRGRGLAFCSGDTDHFHFFRRIIKICC